MPRKHFGSVYNKLLIIYFGKPSATGEAVLKGCSRYTSQLIKLYNENILMCCIKGCDKNPPFYNLKVWGFITHRARKWNWMPYGL